MIENWKDLFRTHILERGLDYYEMGTVKNMKETANGFHATVAGSENYEVEIEIQDSRVYDMWCSCPYAEDGTYCKHMAAVLYECEGKGAEGAKKTKNMTWEQQFSESLKELTAVIDKIPEEELRSILIQLALENESFKNHIITKYSLSISENQMMRLKREITNIGYIYSGRSGFIDWRNAGDYTAAMENFLYRNVQAVIDQGCYMQAFELTNDVFIQIGNQDMDDSDGGTTTVAIACYEFWKQILDQCSESDKEKMFQWFEKHQSEGTVIDFMEEYINDFLMNEFHDKELLELKLQRLDEMIDRAGEKTDCGNWWSAHYGYENNILKRLEIMRELDYSEEEICEYRRNNWRFSAIRKLEIEECLSEGKITEGIHILKESKVLDKEYPGLVAEYSTKLIDLFDRQNQYKEYKEELIFQVFSCRQINLDYVNKLKGVCEPAEWEAYRGEILKEKTGWLIKYPLLKAEKMYEQLLQELIAEDSISSLDKYEKVLKNKFPEQMRDAYITCIGKQADIVSDRKGYQYLMVYLKKIKTYPGGYEMAASIAAEWRGCYCRRPAMMDELRKVGF